MNKKLVVLKYVSFFWSLVGVVWQILGIFVMVEQGRFIVLREVFGYGYGVRVLDLFFI